MMHFDFQLKTAYSANSTERLRLITAKLPISERSHLFCGSQNHRMVGVGRDLCGSSSPTALQKQGHLEQYNS